MGTNFTLEEFLKALATCDGGEAIELISGFQSGAITVEYISVEDLGEE